MQLKIGIDRGHGATEYQGGFQVVSKLALAIDHAAERIDITFNGGQRVFDSPCDLDGLLFGQEHADRLKPVNDSQPNIFLLPLARNAYVLLAKPLEISTDGSHDRIKDDGQVALG